MRLSPIGYVSQWAGRPVESLRCLRSPAECSSSRREESDLIAGMDQPPTLCRFLTGRAAPCGTGASTGQPTMRVGIISTSGSPVVLSVPLEETVEGLRTRISRRLRLQKERIVLVHKHRQLTAGSLSDLGVTDGSRLTLMPVIEAGLVCPSLRAEKSFKDILESLTEVQVRDFLSGHSPIYINLEVGSHVMYVELQLSAQDVTELQRKQDLKAVHINPSRTDAPPTSQTFTSAPGSPLSQFSPQRPRTHFNSKDCPSLSENATHAQTCSHQFCPSPSSPGRPLASVRPRLSCPQQSGCSPRSSSAESPASAVEKASSAQEQIKRPGAIIESFVSHSPGFYSGTFSGTLASSPQCSISQHQYGVAIILQILEDLLKAPYRCQGPPPVPSGLHSRVSNTEEEQSIAESKTVTEKQRAEQLTINSGECQLHSSTQGNQTLHFKLKQLQLMMHQRRQQRLSRRKVQTSTPHPY